MAQEVQVATLVAVAFLPPLLLLAYVRSRERHGREPFTGLLRAFLFGGTIAVGLAVLLELALIRFDLSRLGRPYEFLQLDTLPVALLVAVVIAPIVEESTKALGLPGLRGRLAETEDGLVYGAAIGLGFAATENLFYEMAALESQGVAAFWTTAVVRSVSSTLLHATAAALTGLGYARAVRGGRSFRLLWVVPYWGGAVALHAAFNLVASQEAAGALGLIVVGSILAFRWMTGKIRALDRPPLFTPREGP